MSKYRFIDTIGAGGISNPCVNPIFDETVTAPPRIELENNGNISEAALFTKNVDRHATIGAPPQADDRPDDWDLFGEDLDPPRV